MSGGRALHPVAKPCPYCGRLFDVPSVVGREYVPNTGDPGLCVGCGALSLWNGSTWREPTDAERAELLSIDAVNNALVIHREYLAWLDADRERLRSIIAEHLAATFGPYGTNAEVIERLAVALHAAGFHTTRLAEL